MRLYLISQDRIHVFGRWELRQDFEEIFAFSALMRLKPRLFRRPPAGQVRGRPRRYERQCQPYRGWSASDHHQLRGADAAPRKRTSGIQQLIVFNAPIHEADALGLGSINHLRENHRCERRLSANICRASTCDRRLMQSDLVEPCIKSCSAGAIRRSHRRDSCQHQLPPFTAELLAR